MFLLFYYKDITPMEYYSMGRGEKIILRAFMKEEIEQRQKELEGMG